jgi:probable F420-dependent oxidoreductase
VQPVRKIKVGLVLPVEEQKEGSAARWTEVRALAQQAEALKFDSLWIPDHLIYNFGTYAGIPDIPPWGVWECWSLLTATAAVTSRITLGTAVVCTSFRNPALLAKMAVTADEISGGRLILGLGAGYDETEFRQYGYPFDHRIGRFEEAVQIIHGLLRNGEVDFHGQYYSAPKCLLRPRGPRPSGIPIMIAGKLPRMRRLAARYADSWNGIRVNHPDGLAEHRDAIDEHCRKVGRDPATLERTSFLLVDMPGAYSDIPYVEQYKKYRSAVGNVTFESPAQMAELLLGFAREGHSHMQIWLAPNTRESIETFAPALDLLA